jgi:hypothetical protein
MAPRRSNHKDKKYNHLTMLYPIRSGGRGKGMYWLAQCDCGRLKEVRGTEAANGYIKTCGGCEHHKALLQSNAMDTALKATGKFSRIAGLRAQLRRYIKSALDRQIIWSLSPEEFLHIVEQDCTYCGAAPRVYKAKQFGRKGRTVKALMNGIDRINSKLGYSMDNVVPCCSVCNRMKMATDTKTFLDHCTIIAKRRLTIEEESAKVSTFTEEATRLSVR